MTFLIHYLTITSFIIHFMHGTNNGSGTNIIDFNNMAIIRIPNSASLLLTNSFFSLVHVKTGEQWHLDCINTFTLCTRWTIYQPILPIVQTAVFIRFSSQVNQTCTYRNEIHTKKSLLSLPSILLMGILFTEVDSKIIKKYSKCTAKIDNNSLETSRIKIPIREKISEAYFFRQKFKVTSQTSTSWS